ncbi:MAG: hypothetical protein IJY61_02840 [Candidatus Gastranaerophilales bacterium]|nr:hypothetical protein [Candidatus Gastranaerophilales bacterium]
MSLSLSQTFNAFKKYDRINVLHFVMALSLLAFLCFLLNPKTISGAVCTTIIGIIAYAIQMGYYVVTSHNELRSYEP